MAQLHAFFRARYAPQRRFEYLSWPRAGHRPKPRRSAHWKRYWKDWETCLTETREAEVKPPRRRRIKLGYWARRAGLPPDL